MDNILFVYLKNTFKESMSFKLNNLLVIIGHIVAALLNFYLWYYIGGNGIGSLNKSEIIVYVLMLYGISMSVNQNADYYIAQDIRSGDIIIDLVRPFNYIYLQLLKRFSSFVYNVVIFVIPCLIISLFIVKISLLNILLFFMCLIMAFLLTFLIDCIFGLLICKVMNNWGIDTMKGMFMGLLSGELIPFFLLPSALTFVLSILPFYYISYYPIMILIGKEWNWYLILVLIGWLIVLYVVVLILWKKIRRSLMINGG